MTEDDHIRAEFESVGLPLVRDRLARGGYNARYYELAVRWIAEKDEAAADVTLRIMRSSKNAAWAAAIAALAAVVVAVIALLAQRQPAAREADAASPASAPASR